MLLNNPCPSFGERRPVEAADHSPSAVAAVGSTAVGLAEDHIHHHIPGPAGRYYGAVEDRSPPDCSPAAAGPRSNLDSTWRSYI